MPAPEELRMRVLGRMGPWFAGLWLFFLVDPLLVGWQHREEPRGVVGMLGLAVFVALYLFVWMRFRERRSQLEHSMPILEAAASVGALSLAALVVTLAVGESGLACSVYIAVAAVVQLRFVAALVVVPGIAVAVMVIGVLEGWGSQLGLVFGVLAASLAVFGVRTLMVRNLELLRAYEKNAELAVENERSRFARDLHDILGHSLTVITVKAELAHRLLEPPDATGEQNASAIERARSEVADLERLSRDALADVRRAVEGYREVSLPGELTRARHALAAAEIVADLPTAIDEVPSEVRELFAWTVREGVTNVIRHSGAHRCVITVGADHVEISDDGAVQAADFESGSGLLGLRERASAQGATVSTSNLDPGFRLRIDYRGPGTAPLDGVQRTAFS